MTIQSLNNYTHIPCPTCSNFHTRGVTIDAIVINNNKILLIKRKADPYRGFWALPGGHLEFSETLEETVKREVSEETHLVVTKLTLLNIFSNPKRHPKQAIAISYVVETTGNAKAGSDALELQYFPLNKLPRSLAFDHKEIIWKYINSVNSKADCG